MYIYTCIYIYIYAHIYIHTYKYTYIYLHPNLHKKFSEGADSTVGGEEAIATRCCCHIEVAHDTPLAGIFRF